SRSSGGYLLDEPPDMTPSFPRTGVSGHAGAVQLKTGIIRAMAGTGAVVTSAGLVFAFTMASMAVSELRVIGQVGTTIGLGLLFDTLVVRSFMTPSIAALLGRWFWWPNMIHSRPTVPEAHTRQGARRIQPHLHRG
ncbi:MMPL family transporter, partial [Mycobacterium tuberculosis]